MKKIILLTGVILMMSVTANACGGITVKGNSGASYCLSKHDMNWYCAYAWCKDQGMKLIDTASVCKNNTSCPELKLSSEQQKHITDNGGTVNWVWTNTSLGSEFAFVVHLSSGNLNNSYYYTGIRYTTNSALCF